MIKGDIVLIKDGKANSRLDNPRGLVKVVVTDDDPNIIFYPNADKKRFYGKLLREDGTKGIEYWYFYNEIVPANPRKGKLIGGYPIQ